ncbi:MAG: hypothetical protein A2Y97_07660 [Nitrospirae bacterium RBG_13_39_12]|nr:MAG: hypothetical protein A2Y97_07660 [Nitrospirae bacterium RBG_13_39_12]
MKKQRFGLPMLMVAFISVFFIPAAQVTAQEPMAFGEIKAGGNVQIESSIGKWVKMQDIYPLLKDTNLRTEDGVVFITTKDGSRIDLSESTEASIFSTNKNYTVDLANGTLTFNMTPSESFVIITEQATIKVDQQEAGNYPLMAGVGAQAPSNIQGVILNNEDGTFIKSDSGRISVVLREGSQKKVLNSGETLLALERGKRGKRGEAGAAGAGAGVPSSNDRYAGLKQALIVGAFVAVGTHYTTEGWRGEGSPSPTAGWRRGN